MTDTSVKLAEQILAELVKQILKAGISKQVNFPKGWLPFEREKGVVDNDTARSLLEIFSINLDGGNKAGFCPHTKTILSIAENVLNIKPVEFLDNPEFGIIRNFCGVTCETISAGGLVKMGFEGNVYEPSCACDRVLFALRSIEGFLVSAKNKPEYVRKVGEKFLIKQQHLAEAQKPNAKYSLTDLNNGLRAYERAYGVYVYLRKGRFAHRKMVQIIQGYIDVLSGFAPGICWRCPQNTKDTVCLQVPKHWETGRHHF